MAKTKLMLFLHLPNSLNKTLFNKKRPAKAGL